MLLEDIVLGDFYVCNKAPTKDDPGFCEHPRWLPYMRRSLGVPMEAMTIRSGMGVRLDSHGYWWHPSWIEPIGIVTDKTQETQEEKCCTSIWGCPSCRLWQKSR